ncbi:hypothetical protein GMRT_11117 [Giardia muris]|uniref:Uncharacterized protein n=1 Tax=Giardia muris TaxID=5742 RepID=A0A4Z1ST62_GIAMU|nr:hypothetical protein GMRT_11117 [Giardia muris]|eukprot:TNJ28940.1 hypothetical protein GMRT_11117 [Giardia muris]
MPKYYRYLAPAEVQFYGLDPDARFITTRRMTFEVGLRYVTVPKGYICRGVGLLFQDFCVPPKWAAYEHMYATHRTDRAVCTREEADLFLFNAYPDDLTLTGDEIYCNGIRVSGDDKWSASLERGVITVPELVTPAKIWPSTASTTSSSLAASPVVAAGALGALAAAIALGMGVAFIAR